MQIILKVGLSICWSTCFRSTLRTTLTQIKLLVTLVSFVANIYIAITSIVLDLSQNWSCIFFWACF